MTIKTDEILEYTAAAGVTIDGVLIKDGNVDGADVSALATASHAAVTLDTNANTLLSLSTQALGLDTQVANRSFAGPASGADAVPTFRALVSNDIPSLDHGAKLTGLTDDDHTQYLLATGTRAGSSSQAQDFGATGIKANVIAESGAAAGVTADGVLLKDNAVTASAGLVAPTLKPAANSTTAVQLQNAAGTAIVNLDTTNLGVQVGMTTAQRVAFYGETAIAQQTAMTAPDETTINSGDAGTDTAIKRMKSRILQLEQMVSRLGLVAARPATLTVTTTGAETLTLYEFTVSRSMVVDWGDGSTSTYTGSGARTHDYAGAGTWTVTIADPLAVTAMTLNDNKITINSWNVAPMVNMTAFTITGVKAGTFNSSDVAAWRPTTFVLYSMPSGYAGTFNSVDVAAWRPAAFQMFSMPSGYAGTFNSSDVAAWRPTTFYLHSMPSGYTGTFNSANVTAWRPTTFFLHSMPSSYAGTFNSSDVTAWRPTTFSLRSMPSGYAGTFNSSDVTAWLPTSLYLHSMPSGYVGTFNSSDVATWRPTAFQMHSMPTATYTITITANGFAAWSTGLNDFQMQGNSLTQAQVNAILWDLYQAAIVPRTATNGTINVGGTNAAPSGTYQAATSCPVTSSTPGKEIAHELLNDGCAVGFNKWATVTVTA